MNLRHAVITIATIIPLTCTASAYCGEIHDAAKSGDLTKVTKLIARKPDLVFSKDKSGNTPLHWAAKSGRKDMAAFLIDSKADINAKNKLGVTPVQLAVGSGLADFVAFLLSKGADLNTKDNGGRTLLHTAVLTDQNEAVEMLLADGLEVDAQDDEGGTPLHWAAGKGNRQIVELLLAHKAKIDERDHKGDTPLHWAAGQGKTEVMETLIADKADIDAKDNKGQTPLHWAAYFDQIEAVKVLLMHGAHPHMRDNYGQTPLQVAASAGRKYDDVAALLLPDTTTNRSEPDTQPSSESEKNSASSTGTIIFYREFRYAMAPFKPPLFCDGFQFTPLLNGTYLQIIGTPGKHTCAVVSRDHLPVEIDISPGKILYFRERITGGWTPDALFDPSSVAEFNSYLGSKGTRRGMVVLATIQLPSKNEDTAEYVQANPLTSNSNPSQSGGEATQKSLESPHLDHQSIASPTIDGVASQVGKVQTSPKALIYIYNQPHKVLGIPCCADSSTLFANGDQLGGLMIGSFVTYEVSAPVVTTVIFKSQYLIRQLIVVSGCSTPGCVRITKYGPWYPVTRQLGEIRVEAGKTYYVKYGSMGPGSEGITGIKLMPEASGAKEMDAIKRAHQKGQ